MMAAGIVSRNPKPLGHLVRTTRFTENESSAELSKKQEDEEVGYDGHGRQEACRVIVKLSQLGSVPPLMVVKS